MESYVVVGGGLAGLAAANALAGYGVQVTLLEQSSLLGGRARTQNESGYLLNFGPHALYRGGIAARTFRDWNVGFAGGIASADGNGFFVRGEEFFPLLSTLGGLLKSRLFNVREKAQAANLFRLLAAAKAKPGETMAAWLDRHFSAATDSIEPRFGDGNGEPAALLYNHQQLNSIITLQLDEDYKIVDISLMVNPDKLPRGVVPGLV